MMNVTMTAPSVNGRAQKTLSHQLDRLDNILDGFAEALNESVADAIRQAVKLAVREVTETVMRELANHPQMHQPVAIAPSYLLGARLVGFGRRIMQTFRQAPRRLVTGMRGLARSARIATTSSCARTISAIMSGAAVAWRLRACTPHAIAAGLAVAGIGYFTSPVVAAVLNGTAVTALGLVRPLFRMRGTSAAQAAV